jgi:hypothetical protein
MRRSRSLRGWLFLGALALGLSYFACQNTWRGMKEDTRENTAAVERKAKDVGLDQRAHSAGRELKHVARQAGHDLNRAIARLRGKEGEEPVDKP